MEHFRFFVVAAAAGAATLTLTGTARADWDPGDPFKMHYPQLPNPQGWDVNDTFPNNLADDFQCTQSGPISDIHFWGSWRNDQIGTLAAVRASIHTNLPADPGTPFSRPGQALWTRVFTPTDFSVRHYGTGLQGWLDCNPGIPPIPEDHTNYFQVNIENIVDPWIQQEGVIYWLDLTVVSQQGAWGWKTSISPQFMDDAVWGLLPGGLDGPAPTEWTPLVDPFTGQSLDLAFVITPAPSAAGLMVLGAVCAARRRRV